MKRLTETQEEALNFIRGKINQGTPPTRVEIAEHFGWKSAHAATCMLNGLEKKGYIRMSRNKSRSMQLVPRQDVFRDAALWDQWKILISVTKSLAGNHS